MNEKFVIDKHKLTYLKSIVQVSPFVQFHESGVIRCMSGMDNTASVLGSSISVFAEYQFGEKFPFTFNIDGQLLVQLLDLFDRDNNQDEKVYVTVNEKNLSLTDNRSLSGQYRSNVATIFFSNMIYKGQGTSRFGLEQWFEKAPSFKYPKENHFEASYSLIQKIIRACHAINCQTVSVVGRNGKMLLIAGDTVTQTSDSFVVEVGTTKQSFTHSIDVNDLKLHNNHYSVKFNDSVFLFETKDIKYWILMHRK